jgi:hypothetical protein
MLLCCVDKNYYWMHDFIFAGSVKKEITYFVMTSAMSFQKKKAMLNVSKMCFGLIGN